MVLPALWYTHCSGGNLPMELWCDCPRQSIMFDSLRGAPPTGPQGRNRGTFVFVSSNAKTFVVVLGGTIQPNGLYSPRCQPLAGLDGVGSTPLHLVPYIGSYHSSAQVIFDTWRAADFAAPTSTYIVFDIFRTKNRH